LPASRNVDLSRGPVLNQASMAIDAAVDAQGVALARTGAGRLGLDRRPPRLSLRRGDAGAYAYWIVCPRAAAKLPKIVAFSQWLLAEAAEDARQLKRLKSKSRGAGR
jgi:LysR family glycine cleavage system transcriptional activator